MSSATHAQDRRRAGTGLGLAICRGFVEALGGWIVARNRRNRSGAVLTIRMPVVPEPSDEELSPIVEVEADAPST